MWALHKGVIRHPAVLQKLQEWKTKHHFTSDLWLTPSQLTYFDVRLRCRARTQRLVVPSEYLIERQTLSAFPLSALPAKTKAEIAEASSPPISTDRLPLIVQKGPAGGHEWRTATLDEFMDASLYGSDFTEPRGKMLLSSSSVHVHRRLPEYVVLLNAQDTSNPFRVDDSLAHHNWLCGSVFHPSISEGLTTVAAQFSYGSYYWVLEEDLTATPPAAPHVVQELQIIHLLHISQLPVAQQENIIAKLPCAISTKAFRTPYIYRSGRWWGSHAAALTDRLSATDVPATQSPREPLLWLETQNEEDFASSLIRHRRVLYRVYNLEQLQSLPCQYPLQRTPAL